MMLSQLTRRELGKWGMVLEVQKLKIMKKKNDSNFNFPQYGPDRQINSCSWFHLWKVLSSKLHSPILTRVLIVWPIIFQFPRVSSFREVDLFVLMQSPKTSKSGVRLPYREKSGQTIVICFENKVDSEPSVVHAQDSVIKGRRSVCDCDPSLEAYFF